MSGPTTQTISTSAPPMPPCSSCRVMPTRRASRSTCGYQLGSFELRAISRSKAFLPFFGAAAGASGASEAAGTSRAAASSAAAT